MDFCKSGLVGVHDRRTANFSSTSTFSLSHFMCDGVTESLFALSNFEGLLWSRDHIINKEILSL